MRWSVVAVVLSVTIILAGGVGSSGSGTPSHAAAETPEEAFAAAYAAALRIFGAVPVEECDAGNNPEEKACLRARSAPEHVARGIAGFGVGDPGGGGYFAVLGRMRDGTWAFWFGTQQAVYHLLTLPGPMIVCAEGDRLNVRSRPSMDAVVVGTLDDLSEVVAEAFALTEPGVSGRTRGEGWYYLSAPLEGWAFARYLSNVDVDAMNQQPPCAWRNLLEAPR